MLLSKVGTTSLNRPWKSHSPRSKMRNYQRKKKAVRVCLTSKSKNQRTHISNFGQTPGLSDDELEEWYPVVASVAPQRPL